LNNSNSSQRPDDAACLAGLSRLVRRVCLLREQGDTAEAGRVQQGELATAIRDFRLARGPDALSEETLASLFAAETERVAEALCTAELLIQRLTSIWSTAPAPVAAPGVREPTVVEVRAPTRLIPAQPPVISDLLDAMLASERTSTRLSPARNS
jgi:hypothetical protein